MTLNISTAARRTIISTIAALVLAAALPQAAFAAGSNAGIWKVDPANSSFSSGSATLTIGRVEAVNPAAGSFIVVSNGNVYLVTSATASDSKGVKPVDYAGMMRDGKAVLIGKNARSAGPCSFRCQAGLSEPSMILTFTAVNGAAPQINDMLASDRPKH
jgi:hypothetical protein